MEPKKVKILNTSSLQINQEANAFRLVGSIVEKGIDDVASQNKPTSFYSFPKPTVVPFPVARHRSHGPHWHPLNSKGGYDHGNDDSENDVEDEEDAAIMEFEKVAAFANPVQRRKKKGMDFEKWKEITQDDKSSLGRDLEKDVLSSSQTTRKTKNDKGGKIADKKISSYSEDSVYASMDVDAKPQSDKSDGCFNCKAPSVKIDASNKLHHQNEIEYAGTYDDKKEKEFAAQLEQKCSDRIPGHSSTSEKNYFIHEQESTSLESEIDSENRARIQQMSAEEIAEAKADIMEKISPALLKVLQKRGKEKLKKPNVLKSEVGTVAKSLNGQGQSTQEAKRLQTEDGIFHSVMAPPSKKHVDDKNVSGKTSATTSSSSWNAWSDRVESIRKLRFSLAGDIVDTEQKPVYDNVSERDYLRTEGDPGAAGYTIKEAVELTRSVIPGQRSLALHLLSSVLDKALYNISKNRTGNMTKKGNKVDKSVDWEAVWTFALGPEPELALSLRICIDDNHNSVILACAKAIQSALSCDANERYFDISEKMATCDDKDIFTAPVFRSRPDIGLGFLQGGYWKYSAKPSNILPFSDDSVDNESNGKHTIQDDVFVAGQDFTAGLVRMGILPRLCYLLETDPPAALEECIVSILIAIVRNSPSCANAVLKCERIIPTIVQRFTVGNIENQSSMIKSVKLLKVLARLDRKTCLEFIKNGYFNTMTWNLYQLPLSIDDWLKLGKEKSKLRSALTIEQLRFWRVCIRYGYCVSNFSELFPALCFWLDLPSFGKLIKNNVLYEFTCISREAYLVLESLAGRLPNLFSRQCLTNQLPESTDDAEVWSWSYVGPMVDLGLNWIGTRIDPEVSKLFGEQEEGRSDFTLGGELSATPLLWVYSAVTHMLFRVLEKVTLEDAISLEKSNGHVPWLPEFVPKIGLELIKYWHLGLSVAVWTKSGRDSADESFMKELIHLRQRADIETSLASTCCLNGMINIITKIDDLIRSAKTGISSPAGKEGSLSKEGKVLEEGIVSRCLVDLRSMLDVFMDSASSGWQCMQSIEMFGRGGLAPGAGVGWGAPGGGFWSKTVLSVQTDARFLVYLLEIFANASKDVPAIEETTFTMQQINMALGLCLTAGPGDMVVIDKTLDLLFDVSVLKYLDLCIHNFLNNKRGKAFPWQYEEEDYMHFSRILSSHFRSRWLSIRVKSKAVDGSISSGIKGTPKADLRLDTIYEDSDMSSTTSPCCNSLMIEWARQNLPLPVHFYLSPITTIPLTKQAGPRKVGGIHSTHDPANLLEVAKCGLFFVLGIETMSNFQGTNIASPIHHVSLTWKLHSLSVNFLIGMEILGNDHSRETFEALQDLYGELLDKERFNKNKEANLDDKKHIEFLRFKSEIHESYSIFLEDLVEQFSSISYGDLIFGRQVSIYLHCSVETSVRLATWNALSNARVLELLPPLERCFSSAEGYLEPAEDSEDILEAYAKSWVSDALDRAAIRGSVSYTIVVHHLSSFIFNACPVEKLLLRNRLVRSLLRDYAGKQQHEEMFMNLIRCNKQPRSDMDEKSWLESRMKVLTEACEGNSSLLKQVQKLKDSADKNCV